MKKTTEVACYLCEFAQRTLGVAIGEERYVLPYSGAKFAAHQLSCGHFALVFVEGRFSNPVTFAACKPGEIISFHRSCEEFKGLNFTFRPEMDPRVFYPLFGGVYTTLRIADGACSSPVRYPRK